MEDSTKIEIKRVVDRLKAAHIEGPDVLSEGVDELIALLRPYGDETVEATEALMHTKSGIGKEIPAAEGAWDRLDRPHAAVKRKDDYRIAIVTAILRIKQDLRRHVRF